MREIEASGSRIIRARDPAATASVHGASRDPSRDPPEEPHDWAVVRRPSRASCAIVSLAITAGSPASWQSPRVRRAAPARHHGVQRRSTDELGAPKTPWGEPDLQGVWSSDDATHPASARERRCRRASGAPRALSDRRAVGRAAEADRSGIQNARERDRHLPQRLRAPRVPADLAHRRSARRPACRVHDPRREKRARAARSRHVRRRSVRHARGLHALRPLHHARHRRLGAARRLRQRQPHRAGAGHGGDQLRDDPRHARHLHRRPAAHQPRASASISATRARAGKATSSSSRRRT